MLNLGTLGSLCFALSPGHPFPDGCVNSVWYFVLDAATILPRAGTAASFLRLCTFPVEACFRNCSASCRSAAQRFTSRFARALASTAPLEAPVLFHARRGELTPTWRLQLPTIISRAQELSDANLARVFIENIAFGLACGVEHVRAQGIELSQALALGGACDCEIILQWLAQASSWKCAVGSCDRLRAWRSFGRALWSRGSEFRSARCSMHQAEESQSFAS